MTGASSSDGSRGACRVSRCASIMAGLLIEERLIHGETHPAVAMANRAVADGKRRPEAIARPRRQMKWSRAALAFEQYVAEAFRERRSAATRRGGRASTWLMDGHDPTVLGKKRGGALSAPPFSCRDLCQMMMKSALVSVGRVVSVAKWIALPAPLPSES
jgi:hypothetical protein